jgi:multidrug resistance efflux pump
MSVNRLIAIIALQLLLAASLLNTVSAQAPIIDRSDGKNSLDGARMGATNARSHLQQALAQQRETEERVERATSQAKAAQAELDAARAQRDAAVKSVEAARKAEVDANSALERALRDRK